MSISHDGTCPRDKLQGLVAGIRPFICTELLSTLITLFSCFLVKAVSHIRGLNHVMLFIYLEKDSECDVQSTSIRNCKHITNNHPLFWPTTLKRLETRALSIRPTVRVYIFVNFLGRMEQIFLVYCTRVENDEPHFCSLGIFDDFEA